MRSLVLRLLDNAHNGMDAINGIIECAFGAMTTRYFVWLMFMSYTVFRTQQSAVLQN